MSGDYIPSDEDFIFADQDLDGCETYEPSAFFAAIRMADRWRRPATSKTGDAMLDAMALVVPKMTGDTSRLVEFLLSILKRSRSERQIAMKRDDFELLIDLLSRHKLTRKPGNQRVPIYRQASWADLQLDMQAEWVRGYQETGLKVEDAVERAAAERLLDVNKKEALISYIRGRLHPDRLRSAKNPKNTETLIRRIQDDRSDIEEFENSPPIEP